MGRKTGNYDCVGVFIDFHFVPFLKTEKKHFYFHFILFLFHQFFQVFASFCDILFGLIIYFF